jgi:anaerobic magnesium-protoporphyrin IX monomethyl ester cyclase
MKIMIVTTPIRPYPTSFVPIGSLSIINYLRKHGHADVDFYNIDGNRPSYADVLAHIAEAKPQVLGISAVVSTAYAYTKRLAHDVKRILPGTLVVVGGGLAASAEILLRRGGADLCVLGEGEKVMLNIVRRAHTTKNPLAFADIPGLMLCGEDGRLINTGYEEPLSREEIYDIDWSDLEKSSNIEKFIFPAFDEKGTAFTWFRADPRTYQPHRRNKRIVGLPGAKGCVARCTFCHRWDKGIRYIPPALIEKRLQFLIEKYNVGFVSIADENFGTDVKWLTEFCSRIKRYDVLWQVAGMRVNCVTRDRLAMMHDAGAASICMGIETGSERMLKVMEKKVKVEDNYNAIQWTHDIGLELIPEIIMGMPGESTDTVFETADLLTFAKTLAPDRDPLLVSINYAQALPGTPLYEFARKMGIIGQDLDSEEKYLLDVSDQDAGNSVVSPNMTTAPNFVRQSWRTRVLLRVAANYVKKYGAEHYRAKLMRGHVFEPVLRGMKGVGDNPLIDRGFDQAIDPDLGKDDLVLPSNLALLLGGKFSLFVLLHPVFFDRLSFIAMTYHLLKLCRVEGVLPTIVDIYNHTFGSKRRKLEIPHESLRKIVERELPSIPTDVQVMAPLRKGR